MGWQTHRGRNGLLSDFPLRCSPKSRTSNQFDVSYIFRLPSLTVNRLVLLNYYFNCPLTPGGRLAAKYVIHTVGPVWSGGDRNEPVTLASCHTESIRVADELRLRTIAFPAISTGIYGYPVELAAHIAVVSSADALRRATHICEVKFVLFDAGALGHFCDAAKSYAENKSLRLDSHYAS